MKMSNWKELKDIKKLKELEGVTIIKYVYEGKFHETLLTDKDIEAGYFKHTNSIFIELDDDLVFLYLDEDSKKDFRKNTTNLELDNVVFNFKTKKDNKCINVTYKDFNTTCSDYEELVLADFVDIASIIESTLLTEDIVKQLYEKLYPIDTESIEAHPAFVKNCDINI